MITIHFSACKYYLQIQEKQKIKGQSYGNFVSKGHHASSLLASSFAAYSASVDVGPVAVFADPEWFAASLFAVPPPELVVLERSQSSCACFNFSSLVPLVSLPFPGDKSEFHCRSFFSCCCSSLVPLSFCFVSPIVSIAFYLISSAFERPLSIFSLLSSPYMAIISWHYPAPYAPV